MADSVFRTFPLIRDTVARWDRACTDGWGERLYHFFDEGWNTIGGRWVGIAAYGVALASTAASKERVPLRDRLVGKFEFTLSRSTVGVGPVDVRTEDVASFRRICLQDNEIAAFVQLGVRRRYQKLRDELLGQCRPMPKDRPHRCLFKERKAAIMIDLDGTLWTLQSNAAELWREPWRNSTPHLCCRKRSEIRVTIMQAGSTSSRDVYALYPFFKWLKLGDFRQEWNHPGWHAAYIAFGLCMDGASSIKQVAEEWQRLDEDRTLFRVGKARRLASLRESPAVVEFRHEYEKHLRDSGTEIDRAVRASPGFGCTHSKRPAISSPP